MPSIQKLYGYCVWAASVALGLLVWNFVTFTNNMTYGRIGKQVALEAGIGADPNLGSATDTYSGYVINNIHATSLWLSSGLLKALTWTLLIALAGMALRAILSKDWRYVLIPGAVFLATNIVLGARTFDIDTNVFTINMMASVSVITLIGVVGALLNERFNFAKASSIPDAPPASMSSSDKAATPAGHGGGGFA